MKWLGFFLAGVTIAMVTIGQLAIRIANPDKTETRLFLDYWWYWALALVAMCVALILFRVTEPRPEPLRRSERDWEAE